MSLYLSVVFDNLTSDKKGTPVMVLKNHDRQKELFIAVNGVDANRLAISSLNFLKAKINNLPFEIITAMGGSLERVILSLKDKGIISCHLVVDKGGETVRIEARPGEGVFLAKNNECEILAEERLFSMHKSKEPSLADKLKSCNTDSFATHALY